MVIRIRKTYFLGFFVALFVLVSAILLTGFSIQAEENSENNTGIKYYTSVSVEDGDSLWSIATEYRTAEYSSIDQYIDEIKSINNLKNDKIKTGETLIVSYYSDEIKWL